MDMTFSDVIELVKTREDNNGWHQPIWWIVAILIAIFLLWWCNKQGDGKADLAAAISNLNGRVSTLEPVVKNNAEQNFNTARTLSGIVQGVQDIKDYTYEQIGELDRAVFKSRYAHGYGYGYDHGRNCGGSGAKFIQRSTYTPDTTTVEVVDECRQCQG